MFHLPLEKIYKKIFKTFDISEDTNEIIELKNKKATKAMVVKRSYVFAVFWSWLLLVTIAFTGLNIFNSIKIFGIDGTIGQVIIGVLVISLLMLFKTSFSYVYGYYKTYGNKNEIHPIDEIIKELSDGDENFRNFFNQISTNILIFILLIIFHISHTIYMAFVESVSLNNVMYGIFDIACLWGQIYSMHLYRKKMIDAEMDFTILTPGKIKFANQSEMLSTGQELDGNKIKTIKYVTPNFIYSFFNLGNVSVLTEGDNAGVGIMELQFVDDPSNTVSNMNTIRNEKEVIIKNDYLANLLKHLDIPETDYDTPSNIAKLKNFVKENEASIKEDYDEGNAIVKESIKNMFEFVGKLK